MPLKNQKITSPCLKSVLVTANREISPNVYVISWERKADFVPGQVIKISLDMNDPPRIYSICSGNKEKFISVLYKVKPGGALTPHLSDIKPGASIFVSDPYGSFYCDESSAYWISTGSGIAPFYSMIKSGNTHNKKLLHGISYANQFYFSDYLQQELGDNYIRCCSREKEGDHFHGRVSDYLMTAGDLPKGYKYYLCGQALMVVEIRDLLIEKGVPYDQIFAEIFF